MKIQNLIESQTIAGYELFASFYREGYNTFVLLYFDGIELPFQVELDINVNAYEDSFGWEQGEITGNERWTETELVDLSIDHIEFKGHAGDAAEDLADVTSLPEEKFNTTPKLLNFIYKLFGGENKFLEFIKNELVNDEKNERAIIDYYIQSQSEY